ncbi:MAG TPA: MBL fold metallo-hydrolase, partial [Chitinophagaceae bacterium]|nr:MBL fold metallo-hydrolase [Chitinophagaceae bacterium]
MKIIPLSEGSFTVDKTKLFVPFEENTHQLQERPKGSLLVEVQPFVVITSKDVLLLDTGLGFEKDGTLQIHRNLMDAGINPSEITKVLMSHLHKDHAGGVCHLKKGQEGLAFPQATYFIQKAELENAFQKGHTSYLTRDLECLSNNTQVNLLDGKGRIDHYIDYEITGAHSLYHQVFWIREGAETIFFGGDDAPQLGQMKHRFTAKYDYDGKKAMGLRQEWWERGAREHWTFLFYHDIATPLIV